MGLCDHGVNALYCDACKKAREAPKQSTLSADQVENWRSALYNMFGPYALIMPVSKILAYKDKLQGEINALTPPEK